MTLSDIPSVTELHMKLLPTVSARIGNPYLSELYRLILSDICLVATERKKIIGSITATTNLKATQKRLSRIVFKPWLWFGRAPFLALLDRTLTEREILKLDDPYQTIMTLFVDTSWQRKGVGRKLVSSLPITGKLYVDTQNLNTKAQSFYRHCGFRFIKTIRNSTIAVKTLTPAPKRKILG